ncbi:hypothetical protein N8K70_03835 [Microbacterium betulae]|uniref:Uncharacterized protein n=1 Tax=Microbacterium betulae TaxID=2981139 RepID=A0AA97I5J8_9MICO|nr:hypothetical protein [Microbacterium sp. AB]WOF23821.1 hypothetical protein N8K70_03835 [Microbacterium sp. AB]
MTEHESVEAEARAEAQNYRPGWADSPHDRDYWEAEAFIDGYIAGASRQAPALDERALGDVIEEALHDAAMVETRGFPSGEPEEWVSEPMGLLVGTITKAILAAVGAPTAPATREAVAEEISGIVVGTGYYSTTIGIDAARESADALLARFEIRERTE